MTHEEIQRVVAEAKVMAAQYDIKILLPRAPRPVASLPPAHGIVFIDHYSLLRSA